MGRKNLTKKLLKDIPARMLVFDILEWEGRDIRDWSQEQRRVLLETFFENHSTEILVLSESITTGSWNKVNALRQEARSHFAEGLVLKHREAPYTTGRQRGLWWKWQTDPYRILCVLVYAQRTQGRNSFTLTELTFAVRDDDQFISFAKASMRLAEEESDELENWVSENTTERFGPVSTVIPQLVFELHFDGIAPSARRKSGVVVKSPRVHRWSKDKNITDVATLEDLKQLIRR